MSTETISLPLSLRACEQAGRPAVAWLVPASDPTAWLDEICRWGVPMRGIRVYVLPRSTTTRASLGALVTAPEGSPRTSAEALPYGLVGKSLYVPAEGELYPAVSSAELEELLPGGIVVFHPSVGLVGFGNSDALSVDRLLDPPLRAVSRSSGGVAWGAARPGVTLPGRIQSLTAAALPFLDDVIDVGREDIGSAAPEELPEPPSGPSQSIVADVGRVVGYGVVKGAHLALHGLARGLDKIGGAAGVVSGDGQPGLIDKCLEWTGAMSASLRARIEWARHREITRLLDLMARDVDEGLRYALPLGGSEGAGHRGIAPPSSRLGRRLVDFSLGALAGGSAADFWDIPSHFQEQLRQSYFEAARREIALGRHRRAAYIYAQLLGDYHAAADALRQGRHHREAAVLYRDRLKKSLLAAECLEEGGFLKEAIEIYEEKGRFEKVGELYAALGDEDASVRAYRRAADASLEQGDRVHAARIHETKLDEPRQALAILSAGWPRSEQPGPCLKEQFALMGRQGWHDGATRAVDVFKRLSLKPDSLGVLSSAMVRVVNSYPDHTVRNRAADAVRVVVAGRLSRASTDELGRLTRCIAGLDPEDRLLERDAHRYLAGKRAAAEAQLVKRGHERPPRDGQKEIRLCRERQLPEGYVWHRFAVMRRGLYAAGYSTDGRVVGLWRQDWKHDGRITCWPGYGRPTLLSPSPSGDCPVILSTSGDEGVPLKPLCSDGILIREEAGTPEWLNVGARCHACVYSTAGSLYAVKHHGRALEFIVHNREGQLLAIEDLNIASADEGRLHEARAVLVGDELWFSVGRQLYSSARGGYTVEFDEEITSLCASPIGTSPRVVVTTSEGGRVIWGGSHLGEEERFAQDIADPLAGFTSDGYLIALSKEEGRVYRSQGRHLRARMSFKAQDRHPLAVLPTDTAGEFAVPTVEGTVKVYSLPAL